MRLQGLREEEAEAAAPAVVWEAEPGQAPGPPSIPAGGGGERRDAIWRLKDEAALPIPTPPIMP